jgi:hypothetical protein
MQVSSLPAEPGVKSKVCRGWWRSIETRIGAVREKKHHTIRNLRKSQQKVLLDSGISCEIRFPVMGQTISVHRVMIVSGDKSEMFLTSGLAQALLNLSNSAFSKKCDFLSRRFEKQSIIIDSCISSSDSMAVGGFKMILRAIGDILACLSASLPGSRSITTEPEHHNWDFNAICRLIVIFHTIMSPHRYKRRFRQIARALKELRHLRFLIFLDFP